MHTPSLAAVDDPTIEMSVRIYVDIQQTARQLSTYCTLHLRYLLLAEWTQLARSRRM